MVEGLKGVSWTELGIEVHGLRLSVVLVELEFRLRLESALHPIRSILDPFLEDLIVLLFSQLLLQQIALIALVLRLAVSSVSFLRLLFLDAPMLESFLSLLL